MFVHGKQAHVRCPSLVFLIIQEMAGTHTSEMHLKSSSLWGRTCHYWMKTFLIRWFVVFRKYSTCRIVDVSQNLVGIALDSSMIFIDKTVSSLRLVILQSVEEFYNLIEKIKLCEKYFQFLIFPPKPTIFPYLHSFCFN